MKIREDILKKWARGERNFLHLSDILGNELIPAWDKSTYAISESLVKYLIWLGKEKEYEGSSTQRLLDFAEEGSRSGWDAVLQEYYRIESIEELQIFWQNWVKVNYKIILSVIRIRK